MADGGKSSLPPGPRLPSAVQALRYAFDYHRFIGACHRRYGPTFTLWLPMFRPGVVTSDRDAIRRLFTGDPRRLRHGNDLLVNVIGPRSLLMLEPVEHLQRRKIELPPFHGERIAIYEQRIRERVEAEVADWAPGEAVDSHPRFQSVTLALILELVLGIRDREVAAELERLFGTFIGPQTNLGMFFPFLAQRHRWNPFSRPIWKRVDQLDQVLYAQIEATRRDPELEAREDVLAMLIGARGEDGEALTDAELRDELVTLVIAGHETTATAIAWGAELLAHHPECAARLRDSTAAGEREYRAALAKEVLRLRTVAPIVAGRHALESFELGGYRVGPEATILIDAGTIHRDPAIYEAPDEFRPERFLGNQPESYTYLPFGGGAHRCLGVALATMELECALEAIARRPLEPCGPPSRAIRRGVIMAPAKRGRIRIAATV